MGTNRWWNSSWRTKPGVRLTLLILALLPRMCAAQANPASFSDVVAKATAARDANDLPGAIELYRQALKLNSQWPDGWWFLGSLQYGTGDYSAARDALSHYLELTPNAAPALAMRGLCEFEIGDYPTSLKDIERALGLGAANQPRNEKILRYHEALLLTRTGRFEDALRSYAFFTKDKDEDSNPELLLALGLAGLRTPLLPKELRPDEQELYIRTGKAVFDYMRRDMDSARAEFQQLFDRVPPVPNAHYLYGYLLYAGDPDAAVVEFKKELEVNPASAVAEVMLAWIPLMQNDGATALPHARKAVAEDPALPSAHLVLGRAFTETGDTKDGIEHLETTVQLQPDNLEVHLALAKAYSKFGRKEDARRERLLCLEMTKNDTNPATHP
ncbi:MAG TPA: tetratricopeptide repeat protein [Candidatus Sulfotelmatobacter sp.]|nr:tetratricopeptide repeat protein [Candidatus Sulfotelmatobacter sp.]